MLRQPEAPYTRILLCRACTEEMRHCLPSPAHATSGWSRHTHVGFAARYMQEPTRSLILDSNAYYGDHVPVFQKFKSSQAKTNGNLFSTIWCIHVVSKPALLSLPFPSNISSGTAFSPVYSPPSHPSRHVRSAPKQVRESFTKMRKGNRGRHRKHNCWGNPKNSTSWIKLSLNWFSVLLLSC